MGYEVWMAMNIKTVDSWDLTFCLHLLFISEYRCKSFLHEDHVHLLHDMASHPRRLTLKNWKYKPSWGKNYSRIEYTDVICVFHNVVNEEYHHLGMRLCWLVISHQCFGGVYCLHPQQALFGILHWSYCSFIRNKSDGKEIQCQLSQINCQQSW